MTIPLGKATTRELVVLDFETTGLTPAFDRTIEVAAMLLVDQQPVKTFHQLMHPGTRLPDFITSSTGITDAMLCGQPRPGDVMPRLQAFMRGLPIVAHNAAFVRGFLQVELERAGLHPENEFLCTMLLASRILPGLPSYQLEALVDVLQVGAEKEGTFHRALAKVSQTIGIWQTLHERIAMHVGMEAPPISLVAALMSKPKKQFPK
jgi:DNA polymerase-3 subunit epsilon